MNVNRTQPSLNRDFALLSVFIVFILVLVSVWVTVETIGNYERDALKQMESESLRLDRRLIVEVENASYILESVGRQIQATGDNPQNISQLYFSFAKAEGPKRSVLSWVNKSQMITVSNNLGVLANPIDVSDRDYVKKSIAEPWKVHIGRPIDGRLSNKWVLPMSLGLTDKNGTYMGSVVIALDAQLLSEEIGSTMKDTGIRFAVTNLALTLVTQSMNAEHFFTSNFDVNALGKMDFDTEKSGVFSRGSLFNSHDIYSYFERSSQYPYIIFLGLDAQQSHRDIYKLLMPRLFQLLIIALFLLFVLWTVRKRIIQPVIALSEQTAAIVRGAPFDGQLARGPLEIEQLASEISRLYEYIEERRRVENELRLKSADLTRIKEAAQFTNQVKAEFFEHVGQELTEPVEIILAHSETIKDQHFGPLGNAKYLAPAADIHESAQQLMEMLEDIRAISKAENGLLGLNETDVDLAFAVQKAIRIFREKHQSRFEIQSDIGLEGVEVRGDELRIKQIVLGILNAASHNLSEGDIIRIASAQKPQEVSLMFSYAASTGNALSRSKHGLDLALARLLVAMHQGTLEVKTSQDRVTSIVVKFPAMRIG